MYENNKRDYVDDLVSVIIPTYNSSMYIQKTVSSALAQTYEKFEILIVDDCSKDDTRDVIQDLSRLDNRIRYIFQEKNEGAAVARNTGLENAKGRYIAFLDSDDVWEPNKLSVQISHLKAKHPFVFCAYDTVDIEGNLIRKKIKIKEVVQYKDLLTRTYISTPTVIFDRHYFGDVKMPLRRTGQDYAFWLLLLKTSDAYGIDEPLVHVMRRGESLSKNKLQSLRDVYEVQTQFENITRISAGFHVFEYLFYVLKKKLIDK